MHGQGAETMVADRSQVSDGLYMTEEQYLALDEATDGNYEFYDGYVVMLRPPSSAYDERAMLDMAGGSLAHAALSVRLGGLLDQALACGEEPGQMLNHPVVLIEVLTPATEKRDRGSKLE